MKVSSQSSTTTITSLHDDRPNTEQKYKVLDESTIISGVLCKPGDVITVKDGKVISVISTKE